MALIERITVRSFDVPLEEALVDSLHGEHTHFELITATLVIGGGPIGMLVALAARQKRARVTITEIDRQRLELARELGFDVLDPAEVDVRAEVESATGTKGCDVVFEVSGTQAGIDLMTAAAAARG